VVTSRATDDNLIDDDQDPRTSDIMAAPRQPLGQSLGKPASANSDPAKSAPAMTASPDDAVSGGTAGAGVSPNGASAGEKDDAPANGGAVAADTTKVDGIPALPADTIGSSRSSRPKEPDVNQAAGSKAADQPAAGDLPMLNFGLPQAAPAKPAGDDPAGTVASGTGPSGAVPASGPASPTGPAAQGNSAGPAGSRPAPAEPPSVSPAAFAWEMPDPPSNSRSSPARTFLRSGTTAKNPSAPQAGSPAALGKPTPGENPGAARGAAARGAAARRAIGVQPKRTARQAHLTVARVEPWSVMKFSFVVSLVAFVILFVAVSVLYASLAGLGVFDSLQRVVSDVTSSQGSTGVNAKAWFSASKVLGYTALLGSLNIVLITAMATIGAVVYNLTSRLVGGVEVTLKETE
jgi:hypothetical protein